ncbi:MAG: hypothetical protein JSR80_00815, partial [Verrucomicrobia bacterium]|nr:hypothetical protein [Verrucomicrobiota bacterium]
MSGLLIAAVYGLYASCCSSNYCPCPPLREKQVRKVRQSSLEEARALAQEYKNVEAAKAYEEYLAQTPSADPQVRLEYAEQLTYARREGESIPIFQELIKKGDNSDRVKRGLALALSWSGRCGEDQALCDHYFPEEALLRRARALAQENKNVESAKAYEEYLAKVPSADPQVKLEYAEQLTYARREGEAIPIFQELIKGGDNSDRVKRGLALALSWSGRCGEDQALCDHYFPEEALLQRARTLAQENKNVESAKAYEEYLAKVPSADPQVKLEYAEQLTYARREGEAIPIFKELIKKGDASDRVKRGLALALSWSGRCGEDQALCDQYFPQEALLQRAR